MNSFFTLLKHAVVPFQVRQDRKYMIEAYDNCSVGNSMCCEWFAKF